jgi:hypothetical protein
MKTIRTYLPAALLAGFFLYACDGNHADYAPESKSRPDDASAAMDSVMTINEKTLEEQKEFANQSGFTFEQESGASSYTMTAADANGSTMKNVPGYLVSSSAARPTRLDSTHRFIRTANLKFRVLNVAAATYRIEDITARFNGYVADTRLESQLQSLREKPVSADSSLETMHYVVTNTIVLRIPTKNLDTALKSLVPLIDYLDYRNINTNDITLDILSNNLAQRRLTAYNTRLANDIDEKGKKLNDVQNAEQSILSAQEAADNAFIENLRKDDQVRYSTVTIYMYQRETIRQELVKREKDIAAYEPGLGAKMSESFAKGWNGLKAVINVLVLLWPLWIVAGAAWYITRWAIRRKKAALPAKTE